MADVMVYELDLAVTDQVFDFRVSASDESYTFDLATAIQAGSAPQYEGPYVVTPLAHNPVILATKDKQMADDVTVLKIPYYETSNESGLTVYIAGEDDLIIGGN